MMNASKLLLTIISTQRSSLTLISMSQAQQSKPQQQPVKVLKFLNDYRKQLALIKTKSFYANHLCKIKCLEGRLNDNNSICLEQCDSWLDNFYKIKNEKNPDQEGAVLVSSESIPDEGRIEYAKTCALAKMQIKNYIVMLDGMLNEKIAESQTKK